MRRVGCSVCNYGWLKYSAAEGTPNAGEFILIATNTPLCFGMGIDGYANSNRINDLRLYSQNDVRFLNQFIQHIV